MTAVRVAAIRPVDPNLAAFIAAQEGQRLSVREAPSGRVRRVMVRHGSPAVVALNLLPLAAALLGYLAVGAFRPFRRPMFDDISLALVVSAAAFGVALVGLVGSAVHRRARRRALDTPALDAAVLVAPLALFTLVGGALRVSETGTWEATDVAALTFLGLLIAVCCGYVFVDARRVRRAKATARVGRPNSDEPIGDLEAEIFARADERVAARLRAKIASVSERRRADFLARELAALEDLHARGRLDDGEARSASAEARVFWDIPRVE